MQEHRNSTAAFARRTSALTACAILATILGLRSVVGATSLAFESSLPIVGGHRLAIVTSGSMEPAIRRGDVVITRDVGDCDGTSSCVQDIRVDDVISYSGEGNTHLSVTNRVVARTVTANQVFFATKGDAVVGAFPSEVSSSRVNGRVIAVIPHLGIVLIALGSRLFIAGTVVLLLTVLFARG
ncbi:MAG: signal peptidase I [Actinobacteria bacterium]|nr:signal peptidase I [Actinomycetota bacterium]